ncbi:MAG: hypothetical protein ACI9NT_000119 [Bacteroidia bacterium]|jgi:hypothetical protein
MEQVEELETLEAIKRPVSELQLADLGFKPWQSTYLQTRNDTFSASLYLQH